MSNLTSVAEMIIRAKTSPLDIHKPTGSRSKWRHLFPVCETLDAIRPGLTIIQKIDWMIAQGGLQRDDRINAYDAICAIYRRRAKSNVPS